jgi:hypothetical protein
VRRIFIVSVIGMALGCGKAVDEKGKGGTAATPPQASGNGAVTQKTEAPATKAEAEPVILAYIKEHLYGGPQAKIDALSEPMEPDAKRAKIDGPDERVFYVTYSIFSETTKSRVSYLKVMFLKRYDGKLSVSYNERNQFKGDVDKEWLAKHPMPAEPK